MIGEILDLGFESVELSHGILPRLLPGIEDALKAREVRICSLHNFCPLPPSGKRPSPNLYTCTSHHESVRLQAVHWTIETLRNAAKWDVPYVVLHLGRIPCRSYTRRLREVLRKHGRLTWGYASLCRELMTIRRKRIGLVWDRVLSYLEQILPTAESLGVRLAIENREAVEELPLDHSFAALFKQFENSPIGYWHDTGHAAIKECLGFLDQDQHLESLRDHHLGWHIHDMKLPDLDHHAPGTGILDFSRLARHWQPGQPLVLEMQPRIPAETIRQSKRWLQQNFRPTPQG